MSVSSTSKEAVFMRCMNPKCLDRRLHYVSDCPPKDISAYEYRKLQEQQS